MDTNESVAAVVLNRDCKDAARGCGKDVVAHVVLSGAGDRLDDLVCRVEGCPEECAARGLCWKHYMRKRRYGSVSFRKRRYNMSPECRYCGTTDAGDFYRQYKSICKHCKKLRAVIQQSGREVAKASPEQTISRKLIR